MLRLSKRSDYAIVALTHLYKTQSHVSAKEIASFYSFPPQLVANVLKTLASAGLVKSKRGVTGGYFLDKKAEQISIGEVVSVIEGPIHFTDCTGDVDTEKLCHAVDFCPSRGPMVILYQKIHHLMENLSLAEISSPQEFELKS